MNALSRFGVAAMTAIASGIAGCGPAEPADAVAPVATPVAERAVSALGRLEPEHGLTRIAAPSLPGITGGVVIAELLVDEGDDVEAGQLLAVTDLAGFLSAAVEQANAALTLAQREADAARSTAESTCVLADVQAREASRREDWESTNVASREEAERARGAAESSRAACTAARSAVVARDAAVGVAEAALVRARADHRQAHIVAPTDGRILRVVSRPGESVTPRGAFEFGRIDRMMAVAEVYETDIRQVRVGQRATVRSAALPDTLTGVVHRIRHKVEKQDELGTDPAARKDARIVEVEVLLDDPRPAAALSNLQVTVVIDAG